VRVIVEEENKDGPPTSRNMGVLLLDKALEIAVERGLDLVEVAPDANPPVCRIMDYGKFLYEQQRKERRARKNQVKIEIKEIQIHPKTDDHHIGFKLKNAREWLVEGMKVRVRIRFRGREITHAHLGRDKLEEIKNLLSDVAQVEQMPNLEGRDMVMLFAPLSEKK
jgi:translation initiation factor IF-3